MQTVIRMILLAGLVLGLVSAVQAQTVTLKWSYPLQPNTTRMTFGSSPAIKDLGADVNRLGGEPAGNLEIVTGSDEYDNTYPELGAPAYGIWRCFDSEGNLEWAVDTKSDEARTSPVIADINSDQSVEIATGTTSGWCVEVMDRFGSWSGGVSDAAWTFPYPPQRNGSFMWHSSPALGNLSTAPHLEGLEVVIGNNPYGSIWALDGDNSDQVDDGITADLSQWGYPGPVGTEGVDWDVLWVFTTAGSVIATPSVGDVDGDGLAEVVCGSTDGTVYCLRGADGIAKWSFATGGAVFGSAGLADFDGNGNLEVIVGSTDGSIYCINGDENGNGVIDPSEVVAFATGAGVYSSPSIGDIDNDGKFEILAGSDDYNVYCLRYSPTANTVSEGWHFSTGGGVESSPALASSGRATLTVYAGSGDGSIYLLGGDGSLIAQYSTGGQIITSPAVGDVDGDGKLEIAFTAWGSPDVFTVLRDNGSQVPAYASEWPEFRHDQSRTGLYPWKPPVFDPDVAVTKIVSPAGSYLLNSPCVPQAVVANEGHNSATFDVQFSIGTNPVLYASTRSVTLGVGQSSTVSFDVYPNLVEGNLPATCTATVAGDGNADNNTKVTSFIVYQPQWIEQFDLGDGGFTPQGSWEWGAPTSGPGSAYSGGNVWATILAGDYANSAHWLLFSGDFVAAQNAPVLLFHEWFAFEHMQDGGNVKVSTDGGSSWIPVTPLGGYPGIATWDNAGIPDQPCYTDSSKGWKLATFSLPVQSGQTFRVCWDFGSDPATVQSGWYLDDLMGIGFYRLVHDVTARQVLAPSGALMLGVPVTPSAVVENWGGAQETFDVSCAIGGTSYAETKSVTIPGGGTDTVMFVTWNAEPGTHPTTVITHLAGDADVTNDTARGSCTVSVPSLVIDNAAVQEGNSGTVYAQFAVHLTPPCNAVSTVDYATHDGTATAADNDYTPVSGTLVFNPGDTVMSIPVPVIGDVKPESDETFRIVLSGPVYAAVADSEGTGTIINDDYSVTSEYYTRGQGFYGNSGGMDCRYGKTAQALVSSLLATGDLVVGGSGHLFVLRQSEAASDAACLTKRLPAGSASRQLPSGTAVFTGNCSTQPSLPVKNGKFSSVLLGQTIALGLNLRLDPNLGGLVIGGRYLQTRAARYVDGICNNGDDVARDEAVRFFDIGQSVLAALGSGKSVADLYALANLGLSQGGGATGIPGPAPLDSIAAAISALNDAFDGARFLAGFSSSPFVSSFDAGEEDLRPAEFSLSNHPNPFNPSTTVEYTLTGPGRVTLTVYSVLGVRVATLVDGELQDAGTHRLVFSAADLASGVYFYRLTAEDISGMAARQTMMKKMIFAK